MVEQGTHEPLPLNAVVVLVSPEQFASSYALDRWRPPPSRGTVPADERYSVGICPAAPL